MDAETRSTMPFEDHALPFLTRLFRTIGAMFSDPIRATSGMRADDIADPLLYGTLVGTVAMIFSLSVQLVFMMIIIAADGANSGELAFSTGMILIFMLFSPLFALVGLFINSGIFHLMLMLVGGNKRGYPTTLRAVAYGQTPMLLAIVPICGGFVGGIWALVLVILGAAYGHSTDGWRAVLAYFLPAVFLCGVVFVLLSSLGLLGAFLD